MVDEETAGTNDFSVLALWPDDDAGRPVNAILRISSSDVQMFVQCEDQKMRAASWIRFRGPRILQWLFTPLCAARGMLVSQRDLRWVDMTRLRLIPLVPPEFWVDIEFHSENAAEIARQRMANFFEPR